MFDVFTKLNPLAMVIVVAIMGVFILSFVTTMVVRGKYASISRDLENEKGRGTDTYKHNVLNYIIEDYKEAAEGNHSDVNTQAIIERNFNGELRGLNLGERFVKNAVSLMIILGLVGTFYGLTLSIGKLVELLSSGSNMDMLNSMDSIVSGLINSVSGMSVAFITSLFGISCSVILTVVNIIWDVEESREGVMVEIEEYLDNQVAMMFSKSKGTEYDLLNQALRATFMEFGDKIETSFRHVSDGLSNQFVAAASDMGDSSKSLLQSVKLFDQSLKDFKENTRDFSEFNHHLRTNIDRMNVGFSDLTEDLKQYSKELAKTAHTNK